MIAAARAWITIAHMNASKKRMTALCRAASRAVCDLGSTTGTNRYCDWPPGAGAREELATAGVAI